MKNKSETPEFPVNRLLPEMCSGVLLAGVIVALAGSFGLLIFTGPISGYAGYGITIALISAALIGGVCALFSGYQGMIAIPQDRIAPIIAFMAAAIIGTMPEGTSPEVLVGTVMGSSLVASLGTGLLAFFLGRWQLANLIRFIPYPVIGGFLAGSGWLLLTGSIQAMTGQPFTWLSLPGLFIGADIVPWLPSAVFGLAVFAAGQRLRHWAVLPVSLPIGIAAFYLWLYFGGWSIEMARENGWLLGALGGKVMDFAPLQSLVHAEWSVVVLQSGSFAAIAITSVVSILLNSSAIELDSNQETDLNRELRITGLANLGAGVFGGMVGFASLSLTRLSREMGGRSRIAALTAAVVCGACFFVGTDFIGYMPKYILGGLLFYLGLRFLHEWVVEAWGRLPRADYVAVILILIVIGAVGYLEGVLVGLLTATILFVVNYSRVHIITHALSGAQHRSNVDRQPDQMRLLDREGGRIYMLKLQGFIFFGSANNLLEDLRKRLYNFDLPRLEYVILDFSRVDGVDSSAALALAKMQSMARDEGFLLTLCHVSAEMERQLKKSGHGVAEDDFFRLDRDWDHAMEWCEDQIIKKMGAFASGPVPPLREIFDAYWPGEEAAFDDLFNFMTRQQIEKGEYLMQQGDESDEMFFIGEGRVSAYLELQNGLVTRLRTMGAGTVVGELGLFLNEDRTASITSDEKCVVYRMKRADMERMREEQPVLASAFHHFMMRLVARRLFMTSRTLQTLLE